LVVDLSERPRLLESMRWLWILLLSCAVIFAGCRGGAAATGQKKGASKKERAKVEMTAEQALRGRVALVNAQARTVILNFPIGWMPALERRLGVYRQGVKVGEVKITGPQMDSNIAADLISGEAQVGDEVRENY